MATSVDKLKANLDTYGSNPGMIQRAVLNILDEVSNGTVNIVDPSNPFVFSLTSAAVLVSGFLDKAETLTRKQYPVAAQTQADLYLHMSDKDYVGRFANPSSTTVSFLFSFNELINSLVEDTTLGIKKLVIPRNTTVTIAETTFSLQYPIEISQLAHGGIQVVYDTDISSPLEVLSTNVIKWEFRVDNTNNKWLYFEIPMTQFSIVTHTEAVNAAIGCVINIPIDDQFYYARVYSENSDGSWAEINTTHTDQVFDINTPTAIITVNDNSSVTVTIPQVYTVNGILNTTIRADIYQTKGELNLVLGNYTPSAFVADWLAIDTTDMNSFVSPLKTFKDLKIYSMYTVSGGSNGISFDTLRTQVITNATGSYQIPITPAQLEAHLSENSYTIIKNIDVVTNRIFAATKTIDPPTDGSTITGISACMGTLTCNMGSMSGYSGVIDNGDRVTITTDAIFKLTDGILSQVSNTALAALKQSNSETLAVNINNNTYLYSPFHYVLDASSNEFDFRAYYLDNPTIPSKTFIATNDTTLIEVATNSYGIVKTDTGYIITILTESGDSFKSIDESDIIVQLGYVPPNETNMAYINGSYVSTDSNTGEKYYQFVLNTNYDLNNDDHLILTSPLMYTTEARKTGIQLLSDMNIFYTTKAPLGSQYKSSDIDNRVGSFLLPAGSQAITQERLSVRFGYMLGTLWKRARSTASTIQYQTYGQDIMAFYEKDIYSIDPTTGTIFSIPTDGSNSLIYNVLHKKGDPILDSAGNQSYAHHKGDIIYDSSGLPIPVEDRFITRQIELMLLDGCYKFATNPAVTEYRDNTAQVIQGWLTDELVGIKQILLEQTDLYFYPKVTIGTINVMVEGGITKNIPAEQSFTVTLFVSSDVHANTDLKTQLEQKTVSVISNALNSNIIAISDIVDNLKSTYGNDVIATKVEGLGGSNNYPVITILTDTAKCSLKKKMVALASGELTITEDITIKFVKHSLS